MKDAGSGEKFIPASGSISAWPYLLIQSYQWLQ
jgi:hypothetical protein